MGYGFVVQSVSVVQPRLSLDEDHVIRETWFRVPSVSQVPLLFVSPILDTQTLSVVSLSLEPKSSVSAKGKGRGDVSIVHRSSFKRLWELGFKEEIIYLYCYRKRNL